MRKLETLMLKIHFIYCKYKIHFIYCKYKTQNLFKYVKMLKFIMIFTLFMGCKSQNSDIQLDYIKERISEVMSLNLDLRNSIQGHVGPYNPVNNGTGIRIYMIDSGCSSRHPAFNRADIQIGPSFVLDEPDVSTDTLGHGTHVLGIAWQIAPGSKFICIRIFNKQDTGTTESLYNALDYIMNECSQNPFKCIVNFSGISQGSILLDTMVNKVVKKGIIFVGAAGNNAVNACNYSPGRSKYIITVASTTVAILPEISSFTNIGPCVKSFAPGSNVLSTYPPDKYAYMSGTSMSTPVVSGVIAQFWSKYSHLSGHQVLKIYMNKQRRNIIKNVPKNTKNVFVTLWS